MFRFETWVTYVSHVSKTRFCFRWKKQQNNYVIQNHVPDSPKGNVPQDTGRPVQLKLINTCCLIFGFPCGFFVHCLSILNEWDFLFPIVMSVLQFTASDYHSNIFKPFFIGHILFILLEANKNNIIDRSNYGNNKQNTSRQKHANRI